MHLKVSTLFSSVFVLALCGLTVRANASGPFVSGGMPSIIDCRDQNNTYNLHFTSLGRLISGSGQKIERGITTALNLECQAIYQADPTSVDVMRLFECQVGEGTDSIRINSDRRGNSFGLYLTTTAVGNVRPITLKCE